MHFGRRRSMAFSWVNEIIQCEPINALFLQRNDFPFSSLLYPTYLTLNRRTMVHPPKPNLIGISLGNQYATLSFVNKDGKPEIIANEDGDRLIPSVLSITSEEKYIGTHAKNQIVRSPLNTIMGFRDVIAKPTDDNSDVLSSVLCAPFDLAKLVLTDGSWKYSLQDGSLMNAEEVFVEYMRLLKKTVENYNTDTITGAVMCCPVDTSLEQLERWGELMEKEVGLPVVRWVHEPMAALLSYGLCDIPSSHHSRTGIATNAIVIDAGASSLKVSVYGLHNRVATLLASNSNTALGGAQLDRLLYDHFLNEIVRDWKLSSANDLTKKAKAKLFMQCEVTKRTLSNTTSAPCYVESLYEGRDFSGTLNRMRFDMIIMKFMRKSSELIRQTCKEANVKLSEVQDVVLVGGVAKVPKFQKMVQTLFEESQVHRDVEADEALGLGCGVEAAWLMRHPAACEARYPQSLPTKDIPHITKSLGVLLENDQFIPILAKGWPLPQARHIRINGQGSVLFKLVEEGQGAAITPESAKEEGSDSESEDGNEVEYEKVYTCLAECLLAIPEDQEGVLVNLEVHTDTSIAFSATRLDSQEDLVSFHIPA